MQSCYIKIPLIVLFLFVFYPPANSQEDTLGVEEILSLSFDELLKIKINGPAALTQLKRAEIPASMSVINADMLKNTPARNIYDLIEIYVPGAIWMIHEEGPHPGIRGIIENNNNKYLLLVNGRNLNNKAHFGAKSELEAWDLNDIDRIEIIRGPGSVIYGPGAVGGVINIITKKATDENYLQVNAGYVHKYDSKSASILYNLAQEKFKLLAYSSVTSTPGFRPDHYLVTRDNQFGIIGKDILTDKVPLDYFADANDLPQIKSHIDIQLGQNWTIWARYTQQGASWMGNEVKTEFNGELINLAHTLDRQFTSTIKYKKDLGKNLTVNSLLSFDSYDTERRSDNNYDTLVPDHPLNKKVDFAEHELVFRSVINWNKEKTELALGAEISRDFFGVGWGDHPNVMRLGDGGNIVNGPNSLAIRDGNNGSANRDSSALFVGNGWYSNTFSLFSEANISTTSWLKILISARLDKNTNSGWLFSPRLALIANIHDHHYLKLISQRSQRMNTAAQLYIESQNNTSPTSEKLDGFEFIYSWFIDKKLTFNFSGYLNSIQVLAFLSDDNVTSPVGELLLGGTEVELLYKNNLNWVGINYSMLKQFSWKLENGVSGSGISYADYDEQIGNAETGEIYMYGYGNSLNNWPNHSVKIFGQFKFRKWLSIHADMRYSFDYQGAKDGITALQNAVINTPVQGAVDSVITQIKNAGVYTYDFRSNLSLIFHITPKLDLRFFIYNLTLINGNKRYSFDSGNDDPAPRRVRYITEPTVFGIKLSMKL